MTNEVGSKTLVQLRDEQTGFTSRTVENSELNKSLCTKIGSLENRSKNLERFAAGFAIVLITLAAFKIVIPCVIVAIVLLRTGSMHIGNTSQLKITNLGLLNCAGKLINIKVGLKDVSTRIVPLAATKIQSRVRFGQAEKVLTERKAAVTKIQSGFRMGQAQKGRKAAVIKIQSRFRFGQAKRVLEGHKAAKKAVGAARAAAGFADSVANMATQVVRKASRDQTKQRDESRELVRVRGGETLRYCSSDAAFAAQLQEQRKQNFAVARKSYNSAMRNESMIFEEVVQPSRARESAANSAVNAAAAATQGALAAIASAHAATASADAAGQDVLQAKANEVFKFARSVERKLTTNEVFTEDETKVINASLVATRKSLKIARNEENESEIDRLTEALQVFSAAKSKTQKLKSGPVKSVKAAEVAIVAAKNTVATTCKTQCEKFIGCGREKFSEVGRSASNVWKNTTSKMGKKGSVSSSPVDVTKLTQRQNFDLL